MLKRAHIVYLNLRAMFASVANALPKGDTYLRVADYGAANDQVEKVPWPQTRLEKVQSFFEGTICWTTTDLL